MDQTSQNNFLVPIAIVIAGAFIAGAIYFGGAKQSNPSTSSGQATNTEIDISPITERDHVLGSRDAEIMIVEYSDTECPFCKSFHSIMKEILRTYGNDVAWVYRHFPIKNLHSRAPNEADATECAYDLGGNQAFWNYIDKLFETTNSNDSLDPSELPKIAVAVGLDAVAFNNCLSSGKYTEFVNKSIEEAVKSGARGTPYSIIISKGGEEKAVINGAEPIEMVKAKIDALLD